MDGHGEQPGPTPGGGAGRSENLQGGVQRRAQSVQGWCPEEGYRASSLLIAVDVIFLPELK